MWAEALCMPYDKLEMKAAHLRRVRKVLDEGVPECDVMVYGARAQGKGRSWSYLDLAVMSDSPLGGDRLRKLAEGFDRARLPFRVETVDWAATGAGFRREIKRSAVLLKKASREG